MEITGLGSAIVECPRIGKMIQQYGEIFLIRVYREKELVFCQRRTRALEFFSSFWAAKEAVLNCLGFSGPGVSRTQVEIIMDRQGRPLVQLHGSAKLAAKKLGIADFMISLASCRTHATATVISLPGKAVSSRNRD
ncbi:MAG: holo-[acyl-carrier-protein] synthase [Gemmataceae bacterium]|nr:holo-[acyl-carrier-protein] synthase [Gemmataceae bacterium]